MGRFEEANCTLHYHLLWTQGPDPAYGGDPRFGGSPVPYGDDFVFHFKNVKAIQVTSRGGSAEIQVANANPGNVAAIQSPPQTRPCGRRRTLTHLQTDSLGTNGLVQPRLKIRDQSRHCKRSTVEKCTTFSVSALVLLMIPFTVFSYCPPGTDYANCEAREREQQQEQERQRQEQEREQQQQEAYRQQQEQARQQQQQEAYRQQQEQARQQQQQEAYRQQQEQARQQQQQEAYRQQQEQAHQQQQQEAYRQQQEQAHQQQQQQAYRQQQDQARQQQQQQEQYRRQLPGNAPPPEQQTHREQGAPGIPSLRPQPGEVAASQPARGRTLGAPAAGGSNPFAHAVQSVSGSAQSVSSTVQSTKSSDNPFVGAAVSGPTQGIAMSHYTSALVSQLHPNAQSSQGSTGCWAPFNQCVWNNPVSKLPQCQQTYNQCVNANSSPPPSPGNPFASPPATAPSVSVSSSVPPLGPGAQRAANQVVLSRDAYFQQLSGQLDGYINASMSVLDNNLRQLLVPPAPAGGVVVIVDTPSNPTDSFNDDEPDDVRNLLNEVMDQNIGSQGYAPPDGSPQSDVTDNSQSAPVAAQPPAGTTQTDPNGNDPNVQPTDSSASGTNPPAVNALSVSPSANPFVQTPPTPAPAPPPEVDTDANAGTNTSNSGGLLGLAQQGLGLVEQGVSYVAEEASAGASYAFNYTRQALYMAAHPTIWLTNQITAYFCTGYDQPSSCPAMQANSDFYDQSASALNDRANVAAGYGQTPPPELEADQSEE
jgi:chemotaxis protein histidine kinase CheA